MGARATLYEALAADGRLLQVLVDLAGNSAFLTNILVRAPGTLDAEQRSPDVRRWQAAEFGASLRELLSG